MAIAVPFLHGKEKRTKRTRKKWEKSGRGRGMGGHKKRHKKRRKWRGRKEGKGIRNMEGKRQGVMKDSEI